MESTWWYRVRTMVLFLAIAVVICLGAGLGYESWAEGRSERRIDASGKMLVLEHSVLHATDRGAGSPALVYLPGVSQWSLHFRALAAKTGGFARSVALDPVGLGASTFDAEGTTLVAQADRFSAALESLDLTDGVVLVGQGTGGLVARLMAPKLGSGLAGIVLLNAAHEEQHDRLPAVFGAQWERAANAYDSLATLARFGLVRLFFRRSVPQALVERTVQEEQQLVLLRRSALLTLARQMSSWGAAAAAARKGGLGDLPLLVLASEAPFPEGSMGPGFPYAEANETARKLQEELAALSTRGTIEMIPDAGHDLHLSHTDRIAAALRRFLTEIGRE